MIRNDFATSKDAISMMALVPFLLITFAIAWGVLALYIFLPEQMNAMFGQISGNHPLFFLAVYAPAIAAFTVVAYAAGLSGLRGFLGRFLRWRCSAGWVVFLLIGLPLVFYVGSAWKGNLWTDPFPFPTFSAFLLALPLAIIKGPVEEFGWRGFALPLLQRKMAPFLAAVVLGIIWGFWHLPAFLLSGTQQSAWSFLPFFVGTITISLLMTALYNASKGSILLAAFMHFQLMNPAWPDAQPYDTYILVIVAVLMTGFNRAALFSRSGAQVEVVPMQAVERPVSVPTMGAGQSA